MDLNILFVSDSHEHSENLRSIVQKTDPDLILHGGDFCNIADTDKNDRVVNEQALDSLKEQLGILTSTGKRVLFVLGNHDPFLLLDEVKTIESAEFVDGASCEVAQGLYVVGFGGCPPGILGNGTVAFLGNPYSTTEQADAAVNSILPPLIRPEDTCIVLSHCGPRISSTSKIELEDTVIESGYNALGTLLTGNRGKIVLNVHGHSHPAEGIVSFKPDASLKVLNPGPALLGKYAEIQLCKREQWEVTSLSLRSL